VERLPQFLLRDGGITEKTFKLTRERNVRWRSTFERRKKKGEGELKKRKKKTLLSIKGKAENKEFWARKWGLKSLPLSSIRSK